MHFAVIPSASPGGWSGTVGQCDERALLPDRLESSEEHRLQL